MPEHSATAQIAVIGLAALHASGDHSIIGSRPDCEGAYQPNYSEIERAALGLGIATRYLPAVSVPVTAAQGRTFGALMRELARPAMVE